MVRSFVPAGAWIDTSTGEERADVAGILATRAVVLLGEQHDRADHHQWQLHTISAVHRVRRDLVLGFEMFPRRVQPVLDRWTAGALSEADFLVQAEWDTVWGYAAGLYLPLFDFARVNRLRMLALNVDRAIVRRVAAEGCAAVPIADRGGVGEPAPARPAHRERLGEVFRHHPGAGEGDPARFERFVRGQLFWDRAMAEAIAAERGAEPPPLVIAVLGRGHVEHGDGVAHQLAALGVGDVAAALPWPAGADYPRAVADLLFGVTSPA